MSAKVARPSDARRAALSEATTMGEKGVPLVSNMFSLDRYYAAADSVLMAFNEAYESGRLDEAYVYGKRFAIFSLNALPMHNYYNSPKFSNSRLKNQQDMAKVVQKLEQVAKWMDIEEIEKEKKRQQEEAERRRIQAEKDRCESEAARVRLLAFQREVFAANLQSKRSVEKSQVEQSAIGKLKLLQGDVSQHPDATWQEKFSKLNLDPRQDAFTNDLSPSSNRADAINNHALILGFNNQNRESSFHDATPTFQSDDSNETTHPRRRRSIRQDSLQLENSTKHSPMRRRGSSELESLRRKANHENESSQRRNSIPRELASQPAPHEKMRRRSSGEIDILDIQALPPPMAPPLSGSDGLPPPPSYDSVAYGRKYPPSALEIAAGYSAASNSTAAVHREHNSIRDPFPPNQRRGYIYANIELEKSQRAARTDKTPIRVTRQNAVDTYKELRTSRRIQVISLSTHQGRYSHSTNGCAVISPLVVSHHLRSPSAVSDQEIVDVIDRECGPLLKEIRGKLGLGGDALIIPSDVHDYLVDKKLLHQESFIGAAGGNILDRDHLGEFLRLLESGEKNSHSNWRTGAALFFREHVVSIVKIPLSGGKWCFDLIDSLPGPNGNATRTRCSDISAFEAYVRYYASTKLSESNRDYIDKNDWNDMMADFDPRVFQGFVWGDRISKT